MCIGCVAYDDLQINRLGQKNHSVDSHRAAKATNLSMNKK